MALCPLTFGFTQESDVSIRLLKTSLTFNSVLLSKDCPNDIAKGIPNKRALKTKMINKHAILISHIVSGSIIFTLFFSSISGFLAWFVANIFNY